MASIHNELRRTLLGRALTRALGVTDSDSNLERFSETLYPVLNLWDRPEWAFLLDERLLSQSEVVAAGGAGVRGRVGVENPVGSGYLVTVLAIQNIEAADTVAVLSVGTGLTIDLRINTRPIDTRWYTPTTGSGIANITERLGAIGGASTQIGTMRLLPGELYPLNVILRPGQFLSMEPSVDNTNISIFFLLRERRLLVPEDTTNPQ